VCHNKPAHQYGVNVSVHSETNTLPAIDGKHIFFRTWSADSLLPPKGIVHILHGMGEHSGRYSPLAEDLVADGYTVIANDHRGHGNTAPSEKDLGHYSDKNGWLLVIADVLTINDHIKKTFPNLPITILGHSMGSFILLQYLQLHGNTIDAVALSGSTFTRPSAGRLLNIISKVERLRKGKRGHSRIIDALSFGSFNKSFKPNRTDFDWLSRDPNEVDKYINDPLCGFPCSSQLWSDLTKAFVTIYKHKSLKKLPQVPYYIFSGSLDPVQAPHGSNKLVKALKKAGINNIKHRLFTNARHEVLNETNREEVNKELLMWLSNEKLFVPIESIPNTAMQA